MKSSARAVDRPHLRVAMATQTLRFRASVLALVLTGGCIDLFSNGHSEPHGPGAPIGRTEGTAITGAGDWRWVPFSDAFCTDATADASGRYTFGTSTTGLAISWGATTSTDLVIFL